MDNILILIDMQNGFINENTEDVKNRICKLLDQNLFDSVILTKYKNKPGSSVEKLLGWKKLRTELSQTIVPEIKEHANYVIEKGTYSGYNQKMKEVLEKIGNGIMPSHVFVAGLDTDSCVFATALDLFEDGIRPIVLGNYCGSSGGESYHLAALKTLERPIGRNNVVMNKKINRQDLDNIVNDLGVKEK